MTADSLRIVDYLGHIVEAIERIAEYTEDIDETAFLDQHLVQDAVIRNIEIIGEAARNIERADQRFVELNHNVPWTALYAMRNRVAHGYFSVDMEIIWQTVQRDLPELHPLITTLIKQYTQT